MCVENEQGYVVCEAINRQVRGEVARVGLSLKWPFGLDLDLKCPLESDNTRSDDIDHLTI